MKLQKLTIHNIASIEDAVIDFDSEPLSTSEVFLISGKTGAGKSTILDAICLALYATTPRLDNTKMQGESADGDKEVKIDDPRQLMRRNTGEAYVELTFTGSNGVEYEARWSVARARNKAKGNLQGKKWQLKNLDKDIILTKSKEIEDEIMAAVGLDFNQFCRTTMLAQGEFTRFLNSNDKDKAEILEKITGTGIYSKIGRKVYEVTNVKEQEWKAASLLVEGVRVMSDGEIADTTEKIKEVENVQAISKKERETADKKLKWLEEADALAKRAEAATASYNEAEATGRGEDIKAKENLSRQWKSTIEAREWLRNLNAAMQSKVRLDEQIAAAKARYEELKGAQAWLAADAKATEEKLQSTETEIEAEKDKADIYANSQRVVDLMESIDGGNKIIDSETISMTQSQMRLDGALSTDKRTASETFDKAKQDFDEQEKRQKSIEQNLTDCKLPEHRKEKETCQTTLANTDAATSKMEQLSKERQRHEDKKKDIEGQQKKLMELNEMLSALEPQIHDAQVKAEMCRDILDKQRESVEKWTKSMRARLKVGDTCPVCQQKIRKSIPHEDEIAKLYAAAEQSWKEADNELKRLNGEANKIEAEIKSHTTLLNKATAEFEKDRSLSEAEAAAKEACRKCGVDSTAESAAALLQSKHDEAKSALEDLNLRITAAEEIEKDLQECRTETEKKRKELENAKEDLENAERAIAKCQGEITTSKTLINTKKEEIATTKAKVNGLLGSSQWKTDRTTDIAAFIEELKSTTKRYNNKIKEQQDLQLRLKENKTLMDHVSQPLDSIRALLPEWPDSATATKEIKNLADAANDLRTAIHSAIEQRTAAEKAATNAQSSLSSYLAANTELDMERLCQLDSHTAAEITVIDRDISIIREDMVSRKSLMEQAIKQQLEHTANKPELEDGETIDNLKQRIEDIDKELNSLGERKGELNLLLRQDEKNKKTQAALLEDASKKKEAYDQWSHINRLIGDATGSKFRRIAQSYVLTHLIHSANSYMRTLSDRYILKVEPGTFVIMLEDSYQGYVSRAASTISGGEGFLVSLALALALSDIGSTISMDTLFIDEGFGTLSGEPLQKAIETLRNLHNTSGRNVGIISHVEELREKIPVQIQVMQEGNSSSSAVRVVH